MIGTKNADTAKLNSNNCLDAIGEALNNLNPDQRSEFKKKLYNGIETYEQLAELCMSITPDPAAKK